MDRVRFAKCSVKAAGTGVRSLRARMVAACALLRPEKPEEMVKASQGVFARRTFR